MRYDNILLVPENCFSYDITHVDWDNIAPVLVA
jgi:hypothetical protein